MTHLCVPQTPQSSVFRCGRASLGRIQRGGNHPAADPRIISCEFHTADIPCIFTQQCTSASHSFLSNQDKRNFLRDPPAGVQYHFDFDQMFPVALVMLQEDELLNRMRFDLVPKQCARHYICANIQERKTARTGYQRQINKKNK